MLKWLFRILIGLVVLASAALTVAIAWPLKAPPPPMSSINAPFKNVDFSSLPAVKGHKARDGKEIPYRFYPATNPIATVLLLHGSSSNSNSMHALASALSGQRIATYAVDIRGHGHWAKRGDIEHMGQPSEDVEDMLALIAAQHPKLPLSLVGFSLGGGLALNATAGGHANGIKQLVLVSPMLGHDKAPSTRKNPYRRNSKWAVPNIPRLVGLSILNSIGIHVLDHLNVISFATGRSEALTAQYSHRLLRSLSPQDAHALLKRTSTALILIAGEKDEVFSAAAYESYVKSARADAVVRLVPNTNHIGMILDAAAHRAIASEIISGG